MTAEPPSLLSPPLRSSVGFARACCVWVDRLHYGPPQRRDQGASTTSITMRIDIVQVMGASLSTSSNATGDESLTQIAELRAQTEYKIAELRAQLAELKAQTARNNHEIAQHRAQRLPVSGPLCTEAAGLGAGRAQRPFGLGAVVHETMLETCSIWGPHSHFYFMG